MIKTPAQLAVMRESGRLLAQVFSMLDGFVAAGRSTLELDSAVEAFIRNELKARPASLGQYDYPFASTPRSTKWCAMACPAPRRC